MKAMSKKRVVHSDRWPRLKTGVRIVDKGPLDDDGRCSFTLLWWQDGRKKAQCFFADPKETLKRVLENRLDMERR